MNEIKLEDLLNIPMGEFKPYCYYNKGSDSITIYFKDIPDYSKQLNENVMLYLSIDENEVVGCRIDGVLNLLKAE